MADTEYTRELAESVEKIPARFPEKIFTDSGNERWWRMGFEAAKKQAAALVRAAALPSASLGELREPELTVLAIAEHIDGWRSATFGWQDDPDPVIAERNKQAAIRGHAAECLRRIRAALAASPASKGAGGGGERAPSYGVRWSTSGYVVYTKPEGRTLTPEEVERALGPLGTSPDQQKGGA